VSFLECLNQTNGLEAPIMEHQRPRWRFRISTLMLLVVIAALASALVIEHRKRQLSEELALANEQMARAEAQRALAIAQQARDEARQAEAQLREARSEADGSIPGSPRDTTRRAIHGEAARKERGP
jgi:hypothetical protein